MKPISGNHKLPVRQAQSKQAGFTLIELMVVTVVLVLISLTTVNLLLTTLLGSTKDKTVQTVKLVGDNTLVQVENMVRSADKLIDNGQGQVCVAGMSALGLASTEYGQRIIALNQGRLVVNGVALTGIDLTATGLTFDCVQSGTGAPTYVKVSFALGKGDPELDRPEEVYQETFTTGVSLRQY